MTHPVHSVANLCRDVEGAPELILDSYNLAVVWDDTIDREKSEPVGEVHNAFEFATYGMHENPFMKAHPELMLMLKVAIINWKTANALQIAGGRENLAMAYGLRCSPYDFFVAVTLLAKGQKEAERAAVILRGADTPEDSFNSFIGEHSR